MTTLLLLAAGEPPADLGGSFPAWAQLSAVAVLVVLMAAALRVAYKFASGAYQREVDRADELQQRLDAMTTKYDTLSAKVIDQYVPQQTEATRVIADAVAEIARLRERRR